MNFIKTCSTLLFTLVFVVSCTKELSYELNKTAAHGSLESDVDGSCLPKAVNGNFIAAAALTSTNYIELQVDVTSAGSYFISTDTLNGYYFRGTGNFTAGANLIKLIASGTPIAAGVNNFLIAFDSSYCYIPVTVLPVGTAEASFTLLGTGSNCIDAAVAGTYAPGIPLTLDNKVTIKVNVTAPGTYSITTMAVNGMTFSGTGVLTGTGAQTIILKATGTPANAESSVISVSAGTSSCTFTINVEGATTADYFPRTTNSNWTYTYGGGSEVKQFVIPETLDAFGNAYTIFMETEASFTDSSGYYRKVGGDYYTYEDIGTLLAFDNPVWGSYIFLKDNVPVGNSWLSDEFAGTSGGTPTSVRARFTILQKDVSVTANAVAYPNTIVVKVVYEANVNNTGWIDLTSIAGYVVNSYSRNVGLIKAEPFDESGVAQTPQELTQYQVF